MKKRKWIAAIVSLCILAMEGCNTPNPQYNVATYDELKDELKGNADILFPDISRYEQEQFDYTIYHKSTNKRYRYRYRLFWGVYANDREPLSETVLRELRISCTTLEFIDYDSDQTREVWSEYPEFKPNMEVDGIAVEYEDYESYFDQKDPENENIPEWAIFPDGTYQNWIGYKFEYLGCQYEIEGVIRLLPEEQNDKDIEQEVKKGREELLDVVQSIIEQGSEKE